MGDATVEVLKGASVTIHEGEFVAIEGRSGSGKSTLMHIMGGLDAADAGRLEFAGTEYGQHAEHYSGKSWRDRLVSPWLFAPVTIGSFIVNVLSVRPVERALLVAGIITIFALIWVAAWVGVQYAKETSITQLRNTKFGFVFQFYHLLPELNVLENTLLAALIEKSWFRFRSNRHLLRERAERILRDVGLSHRMKHRPNQLSGGERQRVAIARALMNNPRVLFADEPTGNLDADTGRQIMNVLEKLHQEQGQTIVMVTHDRALAREADRVLVLKDGKLEKAE